MSRSGVFLAPGHAGIPGDGADRDDRSTGAAPRGVVIADHGHATAQVEAIDYAARTVVLKGEGGDAD